MNPVVCICNPFQNLIGCICTCIVDTDNLNILKCLFLYAPDTAFQILFYIVYGNKN